MNNTEKSKRSGFAVLIGRSNVGKSTLLNALVGTKIAIVTPKAQTTRHAVQGARTTEEGQIVFVDTPGIFHKKNDKLTARLTERAKSSLQDIDVIVYVADPTRPIGPEEETTIKLAKFSNRPRILAINKMDEKKLPYLGQYKELAGDFNEAIEISALKGTNLKGLIEMIFKYLPRGDFFYPEGQFTNLGSDFRLEELIREKIFLLLKDEIPYSTTVKLEEIDESASLLKIEADIITDQPRYKKILIGKGGSMIKQIGKKAREEIEALTGKKVFLKLEIKIDEKWKERSA